MADQDKFKADIDSLVGGAVSKEGAKNLLAMLFPKAEKVLQAFLPFSQTNRSVRVRNRRVSEREFALNYFGLEPDSFGWGRTEFELLLSEDDPKKFFQKVREKASGLNPGKQSRLRRIVLEVLSDAFGEKRKFTVGWLREILDESPYFLKSKDIDNTHAFTIDNEDRLRWLVLGALKSLPADERSFFLKSVVPEVRDLTLLSEIVRSAGDVHPGGATKEDFDLGPDDREIRDQLLARVRQEAERGDIWKQAHPIKLLWFWWGCDLEAEVKSYTGRAMETEAGLKALLDGAVGLVLSSSGNYERVGRGWEMIVNLDRLEDHARKLEGSLNSADSELAQRFLNALEKGRESSY